MTAIRQERLLDFDAREDSARSRLWTEPFHQDLAAAARGPFAGGWPVLRCDRQGQASSAACGCGTSAAGPGKSALLLGPLAVAPEHRSNGLGGKLMKQAIAVPRACAVMVRSCSSVTRPTTTVSASRPRRPDRCGCRAAMTSTGCSG